MGPIPEDTPVVRLIQATNLLRLCQKMIQARVHAPAEEKGLMLFKPEGDFTDRNGMQVAEAAVELTGEL